MAHDTPPKYPITFEYIPLFLAHILMHFNVVLNVSTFLTEFNIISATLRPLKVLLRNNKPLRLFEHYSSK